MLALKLIGEHPFIIPCNRNELQVMHLCQFDKIDESISINCNPVSGLKKGEERKSDRIECAGCDSQMLCVGLYTHAAQPVYRCRLVVRHSGRILVVKKFCELTFLHDREGRIGDHGIALLKGTGESEIDTASGQIIR